MSIDRSRLPALLPEPSVQFPPVTRQTLSSGLQLWTVERPDVPVLTVTVLVPTGSAGDPSHHPGLAALAADLLDEGTREHDAIALHAALARIGAQLDADAGYDTTVVSLSTLARFEREALSLLASIVFRPRLEESDFHRIRELRCNRLRQLKDLPGALAEQAFVREVFGSHPYGHLPIGSEASLRALSVDAVRAFHAKHYLPKGSLLIAVGAVSHGEMVRSADEAFSGLNINEAGAFPTLSTPQQAHAGRRLVLVDRPDAPQSELRIGHLAASRSTPDYHPLIVLNALLGGQFVSRINLNLREAKGFTYGARSVFDWHRADGPFIVQTSVQTDATAAAVTEVLRELADVIDARPPSDREIEVARASLTRGYARNFETTDQIVRALAQMATYELPESWFDAFVGRVRAVDAAAVSRVARRYLRPAEAVVVVVGDRARVEGPLSAIGFDTIEVVPSA